MPQCGCGQNLDFIPLGRQFCNGNPLTGGQSHAVIGQFLAARVGPMRFHSLKTRLILPLLIASMVAASLVAVASYLLAQRATAAQLDQRFSTIRRAIEQTNFPLSRSVLMTLSELTSAQWITLAPSGAVLDGTTARADGPMTAEERQRWGDLLIGVEVIEKSGTEADIPTTLRVESHVYRLKRFRMASGARRSYDAVPRDTEVQDVVVMFDDADWRDIRLQAAAGPLVTGLSTIVLLSSVALYLASRLVARLKRLHREVELIAQGNFSGHLEAGPDDEIGRLGRAVETMAAQLQQMWDALGRQHGQRLLHQIAGGLAHNLRNSLTGARMAVQWHARDYARSVGGDGPREHETEGLQIAIHQLDQAEDYVRRLLLVSQGKQDVDRPATVGESLNGIIGSLDNSAKHLGVRLVWAIDADVSSWQVSDGPTLTSAVTNLVWNAIQAGKSVSVDVRNSMREGAGEPRRWIRVEVADDGPGPSAAVAETLFEPLVTTKPEGLGLGLPLVRRSAESLGGDVQWERRKDHTVFSFVFPAVS